MPEYCHLGVLSWLLKHISSVWTALLLEFVSIAAYGIDGFAFAAESISGKYFGAKDKEKFKKAVYYCFYWGFGLGAVYGLAYLFFGRNILEVLTSQAEVVNIAMDYIWWLVLFPVLSVVPFVWDGVYWQIGRAR